MTRGRAELRWDDESRHWVLTAIPSATIEARIIAVFDPPKQAAISGSARLLRESHRRWELTIFRMDGRIARGGARKRTYGGADPRRSKG